MRDLDFVGADPDSKDGKCPAVFMDPATGDAYYQGKLVTDPETLEGLGEHISRNADEAIVWHPARMRPIVAEAVTGSYSRDRQGPGVPEHNELFAMAKRSAVHLEMRDTYEPDDPAFHDWLAGGSGRSDRSGWGDIVTSAASRGVQFRRVRIVSEPVSDYIAFEHAVTDENIKFGEQVRWLPRRRVWDLMLPGADFWMFDQRLVVFNFNAGDGTDTEELEFTTDPRMVSQCVAAFEMAWERGIDHADYTPPRR